MTKLFDPIRCGDLDLANRIVMAPLTRNRAGPGQVPSELAVEYYRQRASAGLIITEASQICPEGQGYVDTPGIHNDAQVAGWRRVTDAVQDADLRAGVGGHCGHRKCQQSGQGKCTRPRRGCTCRIPGHRSPPQDSSRACIRLGRSAAGFGTLPGYNPWAF